MSKAVIKIEVDNEEVKVEASHVCALDIIRALDALNDCLKEIAKKQIKGVR